MKKYTIILLLLCASFVLGAQDKAAFNPNSVKIKLLKNREAQLKTQIDSLKRTVFDGSDPAAQERWNYVKDSTTLAIRSEIVAISLEIKEYE